MDNNDKIVRFSNTVKSALEDGLLINITFSSFPKGEVGKVKGKPKMIGRKIVLQNEFFLTEGRVRHENVAPDDVESAVRSLIDQGAKNCQMLAVNGTATLMVSSKGIVNTTYKMNRDLHSLFPAVSGNNSDKNYVFSGKEDFMRELGISDKEGRVHDKKQSKFRQINRFVEQIKDIMKHLPEEGTLTVYDLCCGKSYLSFAVYEYLTRVCNREAVMICADLKKSVIEYCESIAKKLGCTGMKFIVADISTITAEHRPDLVISLHACDTATDVVLDFAVKNKARVILSTPCCQHEMFRIMNCPELEFISKYSILKQKIASAATDALRLAKLAANGYKTDAIELIDPDETPKNVLLRGVLKSGEVSQDKLDYYKKSYTFLTGELPEGD